MDADHRPVEAAFVSVVYGLDGLGNNLKAFLTQLQVVAEEFNGKYYGGWTVFKRGHATLICSVGLLLWLFWFTVSQTMCSTIYTSCIRTLLDTKNVKANKQKKLYLETIEKIWDKKKTFF